MYEIAHSQSLLNIEKDANFLESTFKPYIKALKYNTFCCKDYDYYACHDDDKYIQFNVNSNTCSIPLKKYKTILYNFAELLRTYNNGLRILTMESYYVIACVYNNQGDEYRKAYGVRLYYNKHNPGDYIIVMLDAECLGFKYFPSYQCEFKSEYFCVYNKHLIDIILNCYTYSQFNSAVNNSTCLLDDILRIVYEYTINVIKK
jgi:hypothetical protein